MKIRLAKDEDYAGIARLHRSTIRNINSKDYSEDIIRVWSARTKAERYRTSANKCRRWVAIKDSKIIGFCDHDFNCEIGGLYIHKDHVGKGIGSRLLKKAEDSLEQQGCKKILIKSTITAKNFYTKNGYKVIKEDFHDIEGKKVRIYVMEKMLN